MKVDCSKVLTGRPVQKEGSFTAMIQTYCGITATRAFMGTKRQSTSTEC